MQFILGLLLIVATGAAAIGQQGGASTAPIRPDAKSETPGSETGTARSLESATLPDAPSYTTERTSRIPGSPGIDSRTVAPAPKPFLNLATPSTASGSLIFAGGISTDHETNLGKQSYGTLAGSTSNCWHGSADKAGKNSRITSLLSAASTEHYCALGEGGFWKRGTYALSRAMASHQYQGAYSFSASELFRTGSASGLPASFQNLSYNDQKLASRYASEVGREALRNMFREFWPDISTHVFRRQP